MAEGVVHGFETVKVEIHHPAYGFGFGQQGCIKAIIEKGAVGQFCQRIEKSQLADFQVGQAFIRHVGGYAVPACKLAFAIAQRLCREFQVTIQAADTEADDLIAEGVSRQHFLPKARVVVLFIAKDLGQFQQGVLRHLADAEFQHAGETVSTPLQAAMAISFPKPVAGVLLEIAQQQADDIIFRQQLFFREHTLAQHVHTYHDGAHQKYKQHRHGIGHPGFANTGRPDHTQKSAQAGKACKSSGGGGKRPG